MTRVHARLAELGIQPYPSGVRFRRGDKTEITDLDASVVIDGVLVAVDCFAAPWRASLDDGDHATTRNRAEAIELKLRAWDLKWQEVVSAESQLLTDEITHVLPVVVTPGPEWIRSADPDLWFTSGRPRICTVTELRDQLRHLDVATTAAMITRDR